MVWSQTCCHYTTHSNGPSRNRTKNLPRFRGPFSQRTHGPSVSGTSRTFTAELTARCIHHVCYRDNILGWIRTSDHLGQNQGSLTTKRREYGGPPQYCPAPRRLQIIFADYGTLRPMEDLPGVEPGTLLYRRSILPLNYRSIHFQKICFDPTRSVRDKDDLCLRELNDGALSLPIEAAIGSDYGCLCSDIRLRHTHVIHRSFGNHQEYLIVSMRVKRIELLQALSRAV